MPAISTVDDPVMMLAGGPAQTAMSPILAAGSPPMKTVGAPGGRMGPPTCGAPPGVEAGQPWRSVMRAAAGMGSVDLDEGPLDDGVSGGGKLGSGTSTGGETATGLGSHIDALDA